MSEKKNIPVREIVEAHLKKHGFDGLYSDNECACLVGDLAPCGEIGLGCMPGFRKPCDCGDHDYHIGSGRKRRGGRIDATAHGRPTLPVRKRSIYEVYDDGD